jgi:hypothetical protein
MSILFGRQADTKQVRLSERQVALADRIFALWTWEIIAKEVRDAMLDRLWGDLNSLDTEVTTYEGMRVK